MCIEMLEIPRKFVEHPTHTLLGIIGLPTNSEEICGSSIARAFPYD